MVYCFIGGGKWRYMSMGLLVYRPGCSFGHSEVMDVDKNYYLWKINKASGQLSVLGRGNKL